MIEMTNKLAKYGIQLDNGFSIKVTEKNDKFTYIMFNDGKPIDKYKSDKTPANLSSKRNGIGKFISKHTSGEDHFQKAFNLLSEYLISYNEYKQKIKDEEVSQEYKEKRNKIDNAMKRYSGIKNPLIWLGSMIDWITAGERINILFTFITLSSQVVLNNPISVIGLGEAASGKTHIMETAFKLLPEEYILREKRPTLASVFRRSEQDKWYYHGKIVSYGDMGGVNDQTEAEDTKAIMKELQSEGYVNRPIIEKSSEDFENKDLELFGRPCIAYTTPYDVGDEYFDLNIEDQELSRSVLYRPRIDNRIIYHLRRKFIQLKYGVCAKKAKSIEDDLFSFMPYVILGLRELITGVTFDKEEEQEKSLDNTLNIDIINPYEDIIVDFLGSNKNYKREAPKYEALLQIIAVFNYFNHDICEMDGQKVMFVNFNDIMLFLTLMSGNHSSINLNLTQTETDIYLDIMEQYSKARKKKGMGFLRNPLSNNMGGYSGGAFDDDYDDNQDTLDECLATTNTLFYKWSDGKYGSKRTVERAFKTFRDKGLAYELDIPGRTIWHEFKTDIYNLDIVDIIKELKITQKYIEFISAQYPEEISSILVKDKCNFNLSIENQYPSIDKPEWSSDNKET